jgi:hypothetical protein
VPGLALGQLGFDELDGAARLKALLVALLELEKERLVTPEKAFFEQRRADRHVVLGQPQAVVDRPRGMPDLEAQVPEQIENRLDHLLAARRDLVGQQDRNSRSTSE